MFLSTMKELQPPEEYISIHTPVSEKVDTGTVGQATDDGISSSRRISDQPLTLNPKP